MGCVCCVFLHWLFLFSYKCLTAIHTEGMIQEGKFIVIRDCLLNILNIWNSVVIQIYVNLVTICCATKICPTARMWKLLQLTLLVTQRRWNIIFFFFLKFLTEKTINSDNSWASSADSLATLQQWWQNVIDNKFITFLIFVTCEGHYIFNNSTMSVFSTVKILAQFCPSQIVLIITYTWRKWQTRGPTIAWNHV